MRKLVGIAEHLLFFLNVLIIFFLAFERYLFIPSWLQVVGRMHPLFLHFPIVVILLSVVAYFYNTYAVNHVLQNLVKYLLLIGALTAAITVVMGILLSKEEGYMGRVVQWHKWAGVLVSFLTTGFYYYFHSDFRNAMLARACAGVILICLLVAGHLGAELTHGDGFLFAPVRHVTFVKPVALEDATIYKDVIAPILETKCVQCHNNSKLKGNLIMTSEEGLLKGGKSGKLWLLGNPEKSLMLHRIYLPEDDKKHMPPKSKPQLTKEEMSVLHWWIKSGAMLDKKVVELPVADTFRIIAQHRLQPFTPHEYFDIEHADEKLIEKLTTEYRVIYPLALNSPALAVNIYNAKKYNAQLLTDLLPLKKQIVSLDLNKMPVTDDDLKIIGKFENLRKLNLNFTNITGGHLSALGALKHLQSLSLSGTEIEAKHISSVSGFKNLKHLYIWNTDINEKEGDHLRQSLSHVKIETGYSADRNKILRLTPPRISNENKIFATDVPVEITHPVKGVTIRYTLDGTEPDSVMGLTYDRPFLSSDPITMIKARAYKEGWFGSEPSRASFYKTSYHPDTVMLLTPPDKKYIAKGSETLKDCESGDESYGSNEGWLGYQKNPFEAWIEFKKPVELHSVILSTRVDLGAYIFPARKVEIWGGVDANRLTLLFSDFPEQPKDYKSVLLSGLQCTFPVQRISYLKIKAQPISQLPSWHHGKGKPGWFFIDEILFN